MRRVLITAGASGIGHAMGQAFSDAGDQVWVTDVDQSALDAVDPTWQRSLTDASDEGAIEKLCKDIKGAWGGLDVICANAGIAGPTAGVTDVDLEAWQRCVSVNLEGAFLITKHGAPLLSSGGVITYTTSTAGLFGYPNRAPYAAAKWGVIGLMKTVAMELGPQGIRANAIAPGAVEGPRMEGVLAREAAAKGMTRDQVYEGYASGTSLRTFVTAQDIAQMAVFLADAPRISGQVMAVDGHTENPDPKP